MNHDDRIESDLKKIDDYLKRFASVRSLSNWSEVEKRDIKNNLNYHSNKIEGLGLNYGDTLSYLNHRVIKPGATAKDLADLANYQSILDIIFSTYDSYEITVEKIKEVHKQLMKDDSQWSGIDPYLAGPGEFKKENNYVHRPGGYHEYLGYELVPAALEKLVETTNSDLQNSQLHPLKVAAQFHYDFLEIHPLSDGNGRVARLLSTLMLLKKHFPPLIIQEQEKEEYFKSLIESESIIERTPIILFFVKKMLLSLEQRIETGN